MFRFSFHSRSLAAVAATLPALLATTSAVRAQAVGPEPAKTEVTHGFELRSGYTGGRFSHNSDDHRSSFNLFGGGGNSRTGFPVEHRYDGLMLGADYVQTQHRPGRPATSTLRVGLDMLGAADRLRIGDGRRATVGLLAAHPHFSYELQRHRWQTQVGVGLLLGRVGYYERETSFDLLSTNRVVDTVTVVPTFQLAMNWNHWVQYEAGYGAQGLLGLANPVYHFGVGTGFGPRSPLAVVVGATSATSTDFANRESGYYYTRLTLAPAGRPWQANAFVTFGSAQYQRVALQMTCRLPQKGAVSAAR